MEVVAVYLIFNVLIYDGVVMTIHDLKLPNVVNIDLNEEEYSIPLNISDIIEICKEYNKLGYNIQSQMDSILNIGIEQSIISGILKKESLPHIKYFLTTIYDNSYFGDASFQAKECLFLIDLFFENNNNKDFSYELN